jgi:tetratricopeptide (TPR) repeat protein
LYKSETRRRTCWYFKKGEYYFTALKTAQGIINSLSLEEAEKAFEKSLSLEFNLPALWKLIDCYLILGKVIYAEKCLEKNKTEVVESCGQYFYFKAVILRKKHQYEEARIAINYALDKKFQEEKVVAEAKLINRLLKKEASFSGFEEAIRRPEEQSYDILSLDGGGIRGIIPLVFLSHLERELRAPVSSVFDLISGTSTGGLIALALSSPKDLQNQVPKYSAADILNLYRERASEIFPVKRHFLSRVFNPTYSDIGREKVCRAYFDETLRAQHLLTETLVPVALASEANRTHYFTRRHARENPFNFFKNMKLFDIAMSTTAAPTYFKAHLVDCEPGQPGLGGGAEVPPREKKSISRWRY